MFELIPALSVSRSPAVMKGDGVVMPVFWYVPNVVVPGAIGVSMFIIVKNELAPCPVGETACKYGTNERVAAL